MARPCINSNDHGKATTAPLASAAFLAARTLLARCFGLVRRCGVPRPLLVGNALRVGFAATTQGAIRPQIAVAERQELATGIRVPHHLAHRSGRLSRAWLRWMTALDLFVQPARESVREIQSVEDLPHGCGVVALDWGADHMSKRAVSDQIHAFCKGELALGDFGLWLQESALDAPAGDARMLAMDALRVLAEFENGDFTKPELRAELAAMAPRAHPLTGIVIGVGAPASTLTGSREGITILAPVGNLFQRTRKAPASPSDPHSGIRTQETTPVGVQ